MHLPKRWEDGLKPCRCEQTYNESTHHWCTSQEGLGPRTSPCLLSAAQHTLSLRWEPYPDQSITIIEKNYEWHNVTGWPGWWQEAQICRNLQLRRKQVRRLKFWHGMVEYQGIGVPWELVSAWVDPPVRGAAGENLTAWPALNEQNFARWDTLFAKITTKGWSSWDH